MERDTAETVQRGEASTRTSPRAWNERLDAEQDSSTQQKNVSGQSANVSLAVSLVEPENARAKRQKT